jgi:hypothetical protein
MTPDAVRPRPGRLLIKGDRRGEERHRRSAPLIRRRRQRGWGPYRARHEDDIEARQATESNSQPDRGLLRVPIKVGSASMMGMTSHLILTPSSSSRGTPPHPTRAKPVLSTHQARVTPSSLKRDAKIEAWITDSSPLDLQSLNRMSKIDDGEVNKTLSQNQRRPCQRWHQLRPTSSRGGENYG